MGVSSTWLCQVHGCVKYKGRSSIWVCLEMGVSSTWVCLDMGVSSIWVGQVYGCV